MQASKYWTNKLHLALPVGGNSIASIAGLDANNMESGRFCESIFCYDFQLSRICHKSDFDI